MKIDSLVLEHIGVVTDDIDATAAVYAQLGYMKGEISVDETQKVKICFLANGTSKIELVEPLNEKSSVNKLLKKNGVSLYHLCYEVEDIEKSVEQLVEEGFILMFRPVEATAFANRLICYLYKKEIGYVELLNKY